MYPLNKMKVYVVVDWNDCVQIDCGCRIVKIFCTEDQAKKYKQDVIIKDREYRETVNKTIKDPRFHDNIDYRMNIEEVELDLE
jgi:hypothetical protein